MPLRYTVTEKWKDKWFRKLKPRYKLLWFYLLDNCDISGIIEKDIDLWNTETACRFKEDEILQVFVNRLIPIPQTEYFWIPKFIEIQQRCKINELNPDNNAHKGILKAIDKYRLTELLSISLGANEGLTSPYSNSNGTSNGKGNGKDIILYKEKKLFIPDVLFEEFCTEFTRDRVLSEIPKMEKWLNFNKPKKDYKRFIFNWLNRDSNNGTTQSGDGQNKKSGSGGATTENDIQATLRATRISSRS